MTVVKLVAEGEVLEIVVEDSTEVCDPVGRADFEEDKAEAGAGLEVEPEDWLEDADVVVVRVVVVRAFGEVTVKVVAEVATVHVSVVYGTELLDPFVCVVESAGLGLLLALDEVDVVVLDERVDRAASKTVKASIVPEVEVVRAELFEASEGD